jgi:hypothetical protein
MELLTAVGGGLGGMVLVAFAPMAIPAFFCVKLYGFQAGVLKNQIAVGNGLPTTLTILTPLNVVNAFAVQLSAAVDLHSILKLAIGLYDYWTQLPLAFDFDFLQNVDLVSCLVSSQMQHSGDCPSSKKRAMVSCGHQGGHPTRNFGTPRWTPSR